MSNDTLLRVVRGRRCPPFVAPNVIGIDDWAWRRNQRYGIIICDLGPTDRPRAKSPSSSSLSVKCTDVPSWTCFRPVSSAPLDRDCTKIASEPILQAECQLVDFAQNQGAAVALTAAIKETLLDWVMLIDSDGQFPIENLFLFLSGLRRVETSAAIGIRKKKDSTFRRFGTWSSGIACNLVYGLDSRT